jgi:hypothetical protein
VSVWKADPEQHDFPAAQDYLELLFPKEVARKTAVNLKKCDTQLKKAKDILRASGLPLLPQSNQHVAHNVDKVRQGEKLSPVLLVIGQPLLIADGYHRVCAAYYLSEDLEVPCRLASLGQ